MAHRMWFLVEWIADSNMFPTYGIVNVDTSAYDDTEVSPGKKIFIQLHGTRRRAQILRISENKSYLEEYKNLLETQDLKVKNMLQICMRTIKEIKSESVYKEKDRQQYSSNQKEVPFVLMAATEESSFESDLEEATNSKNFNKVSQLDLSAIKIPPTDRAKSQSHYNRPLQNYTNFKSRSLKSSTPLPRKSVQENFKLCFDQATQTDDTLLQPPLATIEELETTLMNLYGRFETLLTQLNLNLDGASLCPSDVEQNDNNNIYETQTDNYNNHIDQLPAGNGNVIIMKCDVEDSTIEPVNSSTAPVEIKEIANTLRVRRMSAQTTNNIEGGPSNDADMVPIGNGNAHVPARLLKEIDWNSHTSATRQLLQAVFSRRVLATHSLTGKQSPAFKNKPPKKILDPKIVEDIILTVSTECGVPKNLARNAITIKCTDEAKLYRNRLNYRRNLQGNRPNEENVNMSTHSSDESSNVNN